MNKRFPYRDVEFGSIYIGGGYYDSEEEYHNKILNDRIANMVYLAQIGCDEIVKRLAKKYKYEKVSNS
jgi:hypothetical protein